MFALEFSSHLLLVGKPKFTIQKEVQTTQRYAASPAERGLSRSINKKNMLDNARRRLERKENRLIYNMPKGWLEGLINDTKWKWSR